MEVITGLCMSDTNETIMCDFLKADMFDRIFDVVCVKDIMMSVYALECLYQVCFFYKLSVFSMFLCI